MLRTFAVAAANLLVAANVAAQSDERPAYSLDDPSCEEDPTQSGCDPAACADDGCDHPPCPTGLAGYAPESGGVFMSWTLNSYRDIKVYRAEGGSAFEEVAYLEFPATRWIDLDTQAGTTYRYQVTAVGLHQYNSTVEAERESPACGVLEVTAVPYFPSPWVGVAVGTAAVVGAAVLRRRR